MSEEVDYAEMLEIPVSTVNVVRKKNKHKRDIREQVVEKVNERIEEEKEEPVGDGKYAESTVIGEGTERLSFPETAREKRSSLILLGEFAAACLLCTTIFLTNIFMSDSAINTFMTNLFAPKEESGDKRKYSDFTLSGVVNDYSDVKVEVSPSGVMSFSAKASVYPVCDGIVKSVGKSGDTYSVALSHSDSFESVITGLTTAYYSVGESVKGNLPVGYSDGKGTVSVMLYDGSELLSCFLPDGENGFLWKN